MIDALALVNNFISSATFTIGIFTLLVMGVNALLEAMLRTLKLIRKFRKR